MEWNPCWLLSPPPFVVSAFGHGAKHVHLAQESEALKEDQEEVKQVAARVHYTGDEPADNLSCQLIAASLPPSKLLKNFSVACPN